MNTFDMIVSLLVNYPAKVVCGDLFLVFDEAEKCFVICRKEKMVTYPICQHNKFDDIVAEMFDLVKDAEK